jgi:hypothetical protein
MKSMNYPYILLSYELSNPPRRLNCIPIIGAPKRKNMVGARQASKKLHAGVNSKCDQGAPKTVRWQKSNGIQQHPFCPTALAELINEEKDVNRFEHNQLPSNEISDDFIRN